MCMLPWLQLLYRSICIFMVVYGFPQWSVYVKWTITVCTESSCRQFPVPRTNPRGCLLLRWNVIIPIVSFLWHQREYPKAISASHCRHHTVKLWSSLRLKPCQYKSCKMLSGICCLILPPVFNSSICSTYCCWGNILKGYIACIQCLQHSDNTMFTPGLFTLGVSYHKIKRNNQRLIGVCVYYCRKMLQLILTLMKCLYEVCIVCSFSGMMLQTKVKCQ